MWFPISQVRTSARLGKLPILLTLTASQSFKPSGSSVLYPS